MVVRKSAENINIELWMGMREILLWIEKTHWEVVDVLESSVKQS